MAIVEKFARSVIDVIFLGKHTPIPVPDVMHSAATTLTTILRITIPRGLPYINLESHSLSLALIATVLPPLVWNLIGPFEYYTRGVSMIVRKPIIGVYLSGAIIATLAVLRSALFTAAMRDQPALDALDTPLINAIAGAVFVFGLVLFVGAYYRLGISGTYLGDYFGIFRDERITAFPFNVMDNPMYDGSSIFHMAEAFLNHKPAGIFLAAWLFIVYRIGCLFEEPFTVKLYAERDRNRARAAKEARVKAAKSS